MALSSTAQEPLLPLKNVYSVAEQAYDHLSSSFDIVGHIVIVDYSKPSQEQRLFVFDPLRDSMIFSAYVAHGKNSGDEMAKTFSNKHNSNQSSLGFYRISEQYTGKYGLSYRLDGLDPRFNDNARSRAIVIHPAWYVSEEMIQDFGRMGRSYGCPALSKNDFKKFTQFVKPGSLLFVYYPDEKYFQESAIIQQLEGIDRLFAFPQL